MAWDGYRRRGHGVTAPRHDPGRRAIVRALVVPTLVYAVATVCLTWPLCPAASDHIGTHEAGSVLLGDNLFVLWVLGWTSRALVSNPVLLFEGNIFHPTQH